MACTNFPNNPLIGDTHVVGNVTYQCTSLTPLLWEAITAPLKLSQITGLTEPSDLDLLKPTMFDSIADAIAYTGHVVGNKYIINDYYGLATPNNSGILFFKVVASGTGTADGGKYIDVAGFQLEQNMRTPIRATAFGAVNDVWAVTPTDSTVNIKAAVQYCADSNNNQLHLDGSFYLTETIKYSTGLTIFGDGPMDALNSLTRKGYGTAILSTADPVFHILRSDELPNWPQDTGSSANVGLMGLTFYSYSSTSATGLLVGTDTGGLRNVTIDNIESRNYKVAIDIKKAYTLFMTRLSFRGSGGGVGTRGVLFSGAEVTSGYLNGAAFYQLEAAIECQSGVFAGFTMSNIDTDACNHVAITSGYISNPALFRNIASEGTITSDFIFNHSSGVCGVDNFSTIVGVTTDHRIRCVGAGRTVIRNVAVNSILIPSGKKAISQEGTGTIEIYGSNNPRTTINKAGSGKVYFNGALYSEPNPVAATNQGIGFTREKSWSIKIGTTVDSRTIVLDISDSSPLAGQVVHNVNTAGGTTIGVFLIQKSAVTANFLQTQAASGSMAKISDNIFELSFTATHNNGTVVMSLPDSINVYRKDVGA